LSFSVFVTDIHANYNEKKDFCKSWKYHSWLKDRKLKDRNADGAFGHQIPGQPHLSCCIINPAGLPHPSLLHKEDAGYVGLPKTADSFLRLLWSDKIVVRREKEVPCRPGEEKSRPGKGRLLTHMPSGCFAFHCTGSGGNHGSGIQSLSAQL
jgi:hypothetical protein